MFRKVAAMQGTLFRFCAIGCVAGLLSGIVLADGTFINFRGEEVRRAIERLAEDDD